MTLMFLFHCMWVFLFFFCFQEGSYQKGDVLALRSGDDSAFWLAMCVHAVSDDDALWDIQFYHFICSKSNGSDEYHLDSNKQITWRDVVLAEVSRHVDVSGNKLVIPECIKIQLAEHVQEKNIEQVDDEVHCSNSEDLITIESMKVLIDNTFRGQRLVSDIKLISFVSDMK